MTPGKKTLDKKGTMGQLKKERAADKKKKKSPKGGTPLFL